MTSHALYRLLEEMRKRPVLLDYSPLYGVKKFTEADGMSRMFLRRHSVGFTAPLEGDEAYDNPMRMRTTSGNAVRAVVRAGAG